ncbi:MAG: MotA/TolQ/ExbB proton channel family protein [Limnohabitans sp.]|nr:MotA/TolQ/ExbB proton channel family protein [Limnohabitans sp.]
MFSIIQAAGWPIWPLILCSILALALVIERLIQLQNRKILPPQTLEQATEATLQGFPGEEVIVRLEQRGQLGPVLASGLRCLQKNPNASDEDVRDSMEMAGRIAAQQLERYLAALATIASAAPLLGLLGTVVGMIEIFGAHTAANNQPAQLAHGISVALYNTAFGLIVAIPALMFWRYFRAVVDRQLLELEVAAERFARHLAQLRD